MPERPMINSEYLLGTLRRMIEIDSALPHEQTLANFLAEEIRNWGIEPIWHEVSAGRPNIYASIPFGAKQRFLVFSGHSDTVPAADGWDGDPLVPTERDGRLYGLGAINMKSGLACMLAAFKAIAEMGEREDAKGRLGIAVVVDQEGHSTGARAMLKTEFGQCDAMLHAEHFFGDSETDYLPQAVTGKVLYQLDVHGRAGHAFRPHEGGINAVTDAARIVAALDKLPLGDHPLLGKGTQCVLKIDGGYREYSIVIPERCRIIVTRLIVPGETLETAREDMQSLIEQLNLDSKVTVEMIDPSYEPYALDQSHSVVNAFDECYKSTVGALPYYAAHRGVVDANVFTGEGGIPTVVFGPKGGLHHRPGEFVVLDSLLPVARIYAQTAIKYLEG